MSIAAKVALPVEEIAEICRRYQVRELAIFGSALRDDFRDDSDIGLLVEFDLEASLGLIEFIALQQELEGLFCRPVDLVERVGLKPLIRDSVIGSSQVIYAV